ncbi:MAG: tyrosine-type recombinase/integrase [Lachnospiraceae bacterium]|nr:tyrosine-type recombinase/integrase [Lachnospiraceae bacterium]
MALNDSKLRSIKPTGKVQKISDGGGLYVHVTEKGTMLWRMAYRYGGKQKTLSFGSYPEISLSSARLLREQARQQLAQGVDPGVVKKEKKEQARADTNKPAGMTFEEVAREWYDIKKGEWSEKNVKVVMWRLQKYVFPEIGGMPISELRTAHVLAALRKIERAYTAHEISALISRVCAYAHLCEYCEANVAQGLSAALPKHTEKHRAAILDPCMLEQFLVISDQGPARPSVKAALRILPYVFLRSFELRGGRWEEVDFEKAVWIIPAERMKMRKEHVVSLATQVIEMLKEWKARCGNETYMFPSPASKSKIITDMGLLNALFSFGYERDEVSVHGFRSTASTLLNGMGWNPDVIEAQLAHKEQDRIRAAYNRNDYFEQRMKMMQAWADYLDKLREEAEHGRLQK